MFNQLIIIAGGTKEEDIGSGQYLATQVQDEINRLDLHFPVSVSIIGGQHIKTGTAPNSSHDSSFLLYWRDENDCNQLIICLRKFQLDLTTIPVHSAHHSDPV